MSDTFGQVDIYPTLSVDSPAGDPALQVLGDYVQAVCNARLAAAWATVMPGRQVIENVFTHDPRESFNDAKTPALYVFRLKSSGEASSAELMAEDWLIERTQIALWWVLPSGQQDKMLARTPFANAIRKTLARALYQERDAAYQKLGDPEPTALDVATDADAILLSTATSTSTASYSGAGLDGAVGTAAISPQRSVTLALGGAPTDWTDGSTITVTGTNVVGGDLSETFSVSAGDVPTTLTSASNWGSVTEVDVDAQATTTGTLSVGLTGYAGRGTVIRRYLGWYKWPQIGASSWGELRLPDVGGRLQPYGYPMLEMTIGVEERFDIDLDRYDPISGATANADVLYPDGETYTDTGSFPGS